MQVVLVVVSDLSMELFHMRDVWKSVEMMPGVQSVMISGLRRMPE